MNLLQEWQWISNHLTALNQKQEETKCTLQEAWKDVIPLFPIMPLFGRGARVYSCLVFEGIYIFLLVKGTSVSCQSLNFPQLLSHAPLENSPGDQEAQIPLSLSNVCELPYVAMGNGWHWTGVYRHCRPSGGQRCHKTKVHSLIYRTTCFQENPGALWLLS